jgi:hypothetical protein
MFVNTSVESKTLPSNKRRSRGTLIVIFLMSLAPLVAALLVYFNPSLRPEGSVSYGTLIQPQRPTPSATALPATTLDGKPFDLASLKGKWLLLAADDAACPESCARKLFILRNSHASQGKHVERLMRVWFITDDQPVPEKVLEAYKGTVMVRIKPEVLKQFLLPQASAAEAPEALRKPMWIIDPLGNLILQYPPEADPEKFRNELRKLLANSRIG